MNANTARQALTMREFRRAFSAIADFGVLMR